MSSQDPLEALRSLGIPLPQPSGAVPEPPLPIVGPQAQVPQPQQQSPGIEALLQVLAKVQQPDPEPTGKERIKTALGDFLSTMGEGFSNRGRGGQRTGSQAIMNSLPPSVRDRMIKQQEKRAREEQLLKMIGFGPSHFTPCGIGMGFKF